MNTWAFLAGVLAGWILGVWMSHKKIRRDERLRGQLIGKRLLEVLKDAEVVNVTITEEGEKELKVDQAGLDELLGNKTRH